MNETVKRLFGDEFASYIPIIDDLANFLDHSEYKFMDESKLRDILNHSISEGMRIYWLEMLYRAHLAAATSIIRNQRWISGFLKAIDDGNLMSFVACFRGFLESAADSYDALMHISLNLAAGRALIGQALDGSLQDCITSKELEDKLIHYSHARRIRKGETVPSTHYKKTTKETLVNLQGSTNGPIIECYDWLCEVTHPAANSVMSFLKQSADGSIIRVDSHNDLAIIESFCASYKNQMYRLMYLGINPCLLILKVLNVVGQELVDTPYMNGISLDQTEAWVKIENALQHSSLPNLQVN